MKTIFNYMTIMALLLTFTGCEEEEVMTFGEERGVNFVIYEAAYGTYKDDYKNLETEYNFFKEYANNTTMELPPYQVSIGVQLEGEFSDKPLKVKVKAEPVEGYEQLAVELPEEVIVEAGEYRANFTVACARPSVYNEECKVKIVFDYDNSDVIAGTKERQEYIITLKDEAIWEDMYVASLEEWNEKYSPYIGTAGEVKVRFIYTALKNINYHYAWTNSLYYYIIMGRPTWGFTATEMDCLRTQLEAYNASHDVPLAESDGTLVTFPN